MIKRYTKKIVFGMLLLLSLSTDAQINDPVIWKYTSKKITDRIYELCISATINANWHLYAQGVGNGLEPNTIFTFTKNPLVSFDGNVKEVGKMERYYDKNFKTELKYYINKVDFIQKVKIKTTVATVVKGKVNYVVCNDRSCLPPKDFSFNINIAGK